MLAFAMFISLILLLLNSVDPRTASRGELYTTLAKLFIGSMLGFLIILLYGVGVPGLRYLFMLIGFGGLAHMILTYKVPEISRA